MDENQSTQPTQPETAAQSSSQASEGKPAQGIAQEIKDAALFNKALLALIESLDLPSDADPTDLSLELDSDTGNVKVFIDRKKVSNGT